MADTIFDNHNYDDTKYAGLISEIQLPGQALPYQLHDPDALHDISELGLDSALVFGGAVANDSALPANPAKGEVWLITEGNREVVWTGEAWEDLGSGMLKHKHNITANGNATLSGQNSMTGSATVTGSNAESAVTGTATVTGHSSASDVTASGSVEVPTVSSTKNYLKLTKGTETFVKSYPGVTNKLVTASVNPAGSAVEVVNSVTPNTIQLSGVSGSTTASKATAAAAKDIAKAGTAVKVPNISVASTTVVNEVTATSSSFGNLNASVSGNCLVFSTANVNYISAVDHTDTTVGSASKGTDISIVPAVANGSITPYTFTEVTVPVAAEAQTVVTGVQTGTKEVATVGDAITLATGKITSAGSGDTVLVGLGTAVTASAINEATLAAGSTSDVYSGETVSVGKTTKDFTVAGTAEGQTWTQDSGDVAGTAAAQTWTQKTGTASVSGNVSVSGNISVSGTTGDPISE